MVLIFNGINILAYFCLLVMYVSIFQSACVVQIPGIPHVMRLLKNIINIWNCCFYILFFILIESFTL